MYGALALVSLAGIARWARLMLATGTALLVGAVAVARVLLGVHYPSDVAAGVALGLAWASSAALVATCRAASCPPTSVSRRSLAPKIGGTNDPPS